MKCGLETIRHDFADHGDDELEREVIMNGVKIECISITHDENEVWFICPKCQTYHLECPKCKIYCKLVGFPGEKRDNDKQYQIVKIHDTSEYQYEVFEGDFYDTFEKGCITIPEEMNVYYLDNSEWYPTGMDGSKFLKWKCSLCGHKIRSVD